MPKPRITQIVPGLHHVADTCNVYLVRWDDETTLAVDFGGGAWLAEFGKLNLPPLKHVLLTHHHTDQWSGLLDIQRRDFIIHAPGGEQMYMSPDGVKQFWANRRTGGCPSSYDVTRRPIEGVQYDLGGFGHLDINGRRIRLLHTPGHGPWAITIVLPVGDRQVVFCGDAAHAGATIHQPYHLEWDHWTGAGALAAFEGVERLWGQGVDILCPSHGPVVTERPRRMLHTLSRRLIELYRVKGSICPGERNLDLPYRLTASGAAEILTGLYQVGGNGFLLASKRGEALAVDYLPGDHTDFENLLDEIGRPRITAACVSHYHDDHSGGLDDLKKRYGTESWMHPSVAEPLREIGAIDCPWLPAAPIIPDHLWPQEGRWTWNEYIFRVGHLPGQTWWHTGFQTEVAGKRVLFSGDTHQPPARWNGTGGFCAFNGSHFAKGFIPSARKIIAWNPDILCAGHQAAFRYRASTFRAVIRWAKRAEAALRALCPSGRLEKDYYLHKPARKQ